MPLAAGARFGRYEVLGPLGKGGMGEVYRARDTTLGRDVALKVLPGSVTHDPEKIARFRREAQVLASLNHPHIAAIYGVEQSGGTQFLVLELVEGQDLAQRLARGRLPPDDALAIARQIADALEAAHERGIVHRDLKPANVALTPDGEVKVLDFGLAKSIESAATNGMLDLATITTPAMTTGAGMILGTAAYMSPEHAKGRAADKRSDVWAFGCVLYEMLTGTRAFTGKDVSDTLASVLRGEPDWALLPADAPARVRTLVRRCLEKDPRQRVADMSTVRYVLAQEDQAGADAASSSAARAGSRHSRAWIALAACIAGAVLAGAWWWSTPARAGGGVVRFSIALNDEVISGPRFSAISPDGTAIAYVQKNQIYLRRLSEPSASPVRGTESGNADVYIAEPVFSPDGRSLVYWSGEATSGEIRRVDVTGGPVVTIAHADLPSGMSWTASGILAGQFGKGIMRIAPEGGAPPQLVLALKAGEVALDPQMLPRGDAILFTFASNFHLEEASTDETFWDRARVVVQPLESGARTTILDGGSAAHYLPSGHLLYVVGGTLFAAPFDLKRHALTGPAVPVLEHLKRTDFIVGRNTSMIRLGSAHFSVSDTGSLVYVSQAASAGSSLHQLSMMDRRGGAETLKLPPAGYECPRLSPDGTRVAYDTDSGKDATVWVYSLSGATSPLRITFAGRSRFPVWSADGQRLAFQSDREGDRGIFWQRADGGGVAERLTPVMKDAVQVPESWSPDGNLLLFSVTSGQKISLWTLSLRDRKATPIGDPHASGGPDAVPPGAVFSPDGRWIAYATRTTRDAPHCVVFVEPFPATGAKYQVSADDDGHHPLWSRDGQELSYIPGPRQFSSVHVSFQPAFTSTRPTPVVAVAGGRNKPEFEKEESPFEAPFYERNYDATRDGSRFIRVVDAVAPPAPAGTVTVPELQVVVNWIEELKRLVPAR